MDKIARDPMYRLLLDGPPRSSRELEQALGLSRVTAAQRIRALASEGLIVEDGTMASGGGRPARTWRINPHYRNLLGVDIGEEMARVVLFDCGCGVLDEALLPVDLRADPAQTLEALARVADRLARSPKATAKVAGLGMALPAPIDYRQGRVAKPSVMHGWDQIDLRALLSARLGLPVALDNDVNLMCMAEQRLHWPDARHVVFIKAGTGIGCGMITDGHLLRGAFGTSGDIGHIQHTPQPHQLCRCGKEGCVEAHAAGWAIARDLRALGHDCHDARDVMQLYARGAPECRALVNASSRIIGTVSADLVAVLSPELLVLGGTLAGAGEAMLAGIRERVYQRCLPLATERLQICLARGDARLGTQGAAMLVRQILTDPR
ncbi:ROK family transcriptional regulator [Salipiger marinus]|uniref:Sugar kinase of the NBD/HSP70 family, may contain an N-terminal HTH domain n=1 Tax=Salipiger marinus TaxID=555512 RepID=A0A1G8M098_9RHOB|nr:ROK family protein [Salipiger marinus]SDI61303.1 Sugar kinase of the NBD/HSP70 family, may contain an N-terminal HTH domain [Salipiger marinus]